MWPFRRQNAHEWTPRLFSWVTDEMLADRRRPWMLHEWVCKRCGATAPACSWTGDEPRLPPEFGCVALPAPSESTGADARRLPVVSVL